VHRASIPAGLLALLTLAVAATRAQAPAPVGGEFRVNPIPGGNQASSNVGMATDGRFVVVWENFDGDSYGVFARRFSSTGEPQAGQFQINSYTIALQGFPQVAVDADGDFVVAWTSLDQDGFLGGVFARRFSSAGAALTAEFMVNLVTSGHQGPPSLGSQGDGDFVVAWSSPDGGSVGVFLRRFDSAGTGQGGETPVNSFIPNSQNSPHLDMADDGDFVVTWSSSGQDGNGYGVFARRFSSAAAPLAPEFQVNTTFTSHQYFSRVGVDADGDFVIVWSGAVDFGASFRTYGQRISSTGASRGIEFMVNSNPNGTSFRPAIDVDADGDFVVAWQVNGADGSGQGVFARHFKASGLTQHQESLVNTTTAGDQNYPSVGADHQGDFIVTWTGPGIVDDIFAQRFDVSPLLDIDGNGVIDALTDGLLVVRFSFGFSGNTLITGAVGPGCTRCDAPSITAYLQSLI
jgi:hypothetical protein